VIILDTTVLVYAFGSNHPLRAPCRSILEALGQNRLRATTTVEVLQEFCYVRARRSERDNAAALTKAWIDLLGPLLRPDTTELRRGLDLYRSNERLGAFDAVLAATAIQAGLSLVSADKAFGHIAELDWVDPAAANLVKTLGL
jgi:predicted nucleic acid-binding protein